jgi:hypothetical protein
MATTFWMNEEIACVMVCFFHQKALLLNLIPQPLSMAALLNTIFLPKLFLILIHKYYLGKVYQAEVAVCFMPSAALKS